MALPALATAPFVADLVGDRVTMWAVGDSADGSARARRVAASLPAAGDLDAFLYLGDVYDQGTALEYERNYAPLYGHLGALTAPCPGNHEWGRHDSGYDRYWERARGVPPPPWYSFRAAGWLLLSLNTEESCWPGSPQGRWLRAELAASDEPVIAFWHRPRFNAGQHGDQPDVEPLWQAVRGRAVAVLSGHDHNLQRFRPVDGITQFVVGAGGRSSYRLGSSWWRRMVRRRPTDPRLAFGNDVDDGALRIELSPARARFAFVTVDGRVLDEGELTA
jgi:hypothetical protein